MDFIVARGRCFLYRTGKDGCISSRPKKERMSKPPMIQQTITSCDSVQCFLVTEHYFDYFKDDSGVTRFDRAILDLARVYADAVLVGAIAVSKYVKPPIEPRVTFDVDVILGEADFEEFLNDAIAGERRGLLDACFAASDTVNHSLIHKRTAIYVDFLSVQSEPLRKRLIRSILENKEETTNMLAMNSHRIRIAKPELIIAAKLNRYAKKPGSEKGLADRLDIVKLFKSYPGQPELLDPERIRPFLNRREAAHLEKILADVDRERREAGESL
jgi:hypothetical protein